MSYMATGRVTASERRFALAIGPAPGAEALRVVRLAGCAPWFSEIGSIEPDLAAIRDAAARRRQGQIRHLRLVAAIGIENYDALGWLVELARHSGADELRIERMDALPDIHDAAHPLHPALLETLRDPRFDASVVRLCELADCRARALACPLPSDSLSPGFGRAELADALARNWGAPVRVAALCAAGRWRFGADGALLRAEIGALLELGFAAPARRRIRELAETGGAPLPSRWIPGLGQAATSESFVPHH